MIQAARKEADLGEYSKTVHLAKFGDCFVNPTHKGKYQFDESILTYVHEGLHHPRVAYTIINLLLFIFAFFNREALILALTMLIGRIAAFLNLQAISRHLNVKLKKSTPAVALGEFAKVDLEINSFGFFKVYFWDLCLDFQGSLDRRVWLKGNQALAKRKGHSISLTIKCDAGMGIYELGPVSIFVSDIFGIYTFEVVTMVPGTIEIRPKIPIIAPIPTRGYLYSEMYGACELQSRGISVNFAGVRPFSLGDSIRHISWKRTAKFGTLIVKEFEKVTNSDVTLIANFNPSHHIGTLDTSTWKIMSDLALGLASQILDVGSSLQFGYNGGFVEKAIGPDQFSRIMKDLLIFDIFNGIRHNVNPQANVELRSFCLDPLMKWESLITIGGTLIILDVLNFDYLRNLIPKLKVCLEEKTEVFLFVIDPSKYLHLFSLFSRVFQYSEAAVAKNRELLTEIQAIGVHVYMVNFGETLLSGVQKFQSDVI